jgi:hypothetical protein
LPLLALSAAEGPAPHKTLSCLPCLPSVALAKEGATPKGEAEESLFFKTTQKMPKNSKSFFVGFFP